MVQAADLEHRIESTIHARPGTPHSKATTPSSPMMHHSIPAPQVHGASPGPHSPMPSPTDADVEARFYHLKIQLKGIRSRYEKMVDGMSTLIQWDETINDATAWINSVRIRDKVILRGFFFRKRDS